MTATTGRELRAQGQADVLAADAAPHRGYGDYVKRALTQLTKSTATFTTEDVRRLVDQLMDADGVHVEPHHPNVIGAVMGGWAAARHIEWVGDYHSTRKRRRYGRNGIWRACAS